MKHLAAVALALSLLIREAGAVDDFPRVPPTEPERAEATFEVLHGFRMELIAAEPLVASPVDVAYDEDGRAYVVEMRDYPYPEEKNAEPKEFPGTVRLIEDADGDGRFDKATIFADQLAWPTSACCWKGGVFVAAAPDIWYFKDTDGDRRADIRRKVFTGFGRYNVQAIMNNLRWGLDNKIYGAAAGNGGSIRHADRADEPPISLSRRDFRFDPVTEKLEAISGGERFGNTFDDWGNRFVCNIRNPVQHVVLEQRYLARNPHFVPPSVIHDCAESGDQLRVFRLSPPEPWRVFRAQRWALEGQAMPRSELIGAGYWTSSSGVTVYRGGAYPPEFRGNVFIGEVAGNLVHRQVLTRDGVTFKSRRADENTEFIRSRDNWFRPVNFANAPDGTLHVVDMYRETIEHPWSIPDDIKAQLDLSSGKDRGRIYRIAPRGFGRRRIPRLSQATGGQLVGQLLSDDSWNRETAQRLLIERRDISVVGALKQFLYQNNSQRTKVHALYTLEGLGELTDEILMQVLIERRLAADYVDRNSELRRHAVILAERRLDRGAFADAVGWLASDDELPVRFQVALTVGNASPDVAIASLIRVARRDAADPLVRAAILSSSADVAPGLIPWLASESTQVTKLPAELPDLLRELALVVGASGNSENVDRVLEAISPRQESRRANAILTGLGAGLARRREKLSDHVARQAADSRNHLQSVMKATVRSAGNRLDPVVDRLPSIELLSVLEFAQVHEVLLACISPTEPQAIQQAALHVLGGCNESAVATGVVERYKQLTPPLREESVNILLSRPIWHEPLIAALEKGDILVSQLSIPQRSCLAAVKDAQLAERAKGVLGNFTVGPRKDVVEKYQAALSLAADAARGAAVYRRECASCHKLGGEGHEVGPNLATIVHRSPQEILIHVLDPNREVSPSFLDYAVRLTDGRVLTGMVAAETDAGLTLRRAENREDTVVRSEIGEVASSGKSLMPEGMEQKISHQEMADLVEFLRAPIEQIK